MLAFENWPPGASSSIRTLPGTFSSPCDTQISSSTKAAERIEQIKKCINQQTSLVCHRQWKSKNLPQTQDTIRVPASRFPLRLQASFSHHTAPALQWTSSPPRFLSHSLSKTTSTIFSSLRCLSIWWGQCQTLLVSNQSSPDFWKKIILESQWTKSVKLPNASVQF